MRTKKKTVEQEKNRNSQKSVKSVQLMGMGVCGLSTRKLNCVSTVQTLNKFLLLGLKPRLNKIHNLGLVKSLAVNQFLLYCLSAQSILLGFRLIFSLWSRLNSVPRARFYHSCDLCCIRPVLSPKNFPSLKVFPFIAVYPFLGMTRNYDHPLSGSHWLCLVSVVLVRTAHYHIVIHTYLSQYKKTS